LRERGLSDGPKLAVGDGALGFWGALASIYPGSKGQRCWVHKTRNVLDKLPKSLQSKGKEDLHGIYHSPTREEAQKALKKFIRIYEAKYPKAANCLEKDADALLAFYDFPAEHWRSIRTTNPIESTFATVRHRTRKSKNCFSRETIIASVFKLIKEAEKRWKKLYGHQQIENVINLVRFIDGESENLLKLNQQIIAA
jgi:putative transposase